MKMIIFDTETTGLPLPTISPLIMQPHIIELGVIVLEDCKIISKHNWLINPLVNLEPKITKITRITDAMLRYKKQFKELLPEIEDVFANTQIAFAHNAPFDILMLEFELLRCSSTHFINEHSFPWPLRTVCTMQEFKYAFGKVMKLASLYEWATHVHKKMRHRALDDAQALYEILAATNTLTSYLSEPIETSFLKQYCGQPKKEGVN